MHLKSAKKLSSFFSQASTLTHTLTWIISSKLQYWVDIKARSSSKNYLIYCIAMLKLTGSAIMVPKLLGKGSVILRTPLTFLRDHGHICFNFIKSKKLFNLPLFLFEHNIYKNI